MTLRSHLRAVCAGVRTVLDDARSPGFSETMRGTVRVLMRHQQRGIVERFAKRFEDALTQLSNGLSKPRTQKRLDKVWQHIGRLKEKSRGIAQHYDIELDTDEAGERTTAVCSPAR